MRTGIDKIHNYGDKSLTILSTQHPQFGSQMPYFPGVNSQVLPLGITVNVDIFAQYIFSHISRSVLGARKYDVSEKLNHYSANRSSC